MYSCVYGRLVVRVYLSLLFFVLNHPVSFLVYPEVSLALVLSQEWLPSGDAHSFSTRICVFKVYLSIVFQRMGSKVVEDNLALWLVFIYLSEIARIGANIFQRKPALPTLV